MIAETVSLSILSLPSVLATVGMILGIILIAGMDILTTCSGFVIGHFKLVYSRVGKPPQNCERSLTSMISYPLYPHFSQPGLHTVPLVHSGFGSIGENSSAHRDRSS